MNFLAKTLLLSIMIQTTIIACTCSSKIKSDANAIKREIVDDTLNPATKQVKKLIKMAKSDLELIKEENKLLRRYLRFYKDKEGLIIQKSKIEFFYKSFVKNLENNDKDFIDEE